MSFSLDAVIAYGCVILAALFMARSWIIKTCFKTSLTVPVSGCGSCSTGACGSCPVARIGHLDQHQRKIKA
jgi:hypothetical protein